MKNFLLMLFFTPTLVFCASNYVIKTNGQIELRPNSYTENYGEFNVMANNELRFLESSGTNYVSLKGPASIASDFNFVLPSVYGSSGQCLKGDGAGVFSFGNCVDPASASFTSTVNIESQNELRLQDTAGGQYAGIRANSATTSYTMSLPPAQCAADQIMVNDGSGNLFCSDVLGGGGGDKVFISQNTFDSDSLLSDVTCTTGTCTISNTTPYVDRDTKYLAVSLTAQTANVRGGAANTAWEGKVLTASCYVKSSLTDLSLCAYNGTTDEECVLYTGAGAVQKVMATMGYTSGETPQWRFKTAGAQTDTFEADNCTVGELLPEVGTRIYKEYLTHSAAQSTLSDSTNEIEFVTSNFTSTGDDVITLDNSDGTRTKFICNRAKCIVRGNIYLEPDDSTTSQSINVYDSISEGSFSAAATCGGSSVHPTSSYETGLLAAFNCELGLNDFITIRMFNIVASNANAARVHIEAEYVEQNDVVTGIAPNGRSIIYTTGAGQSISNATDTIVDFGTKVQDVSNTVTTGGSWKFTANADGDYEVCAAILFDSASFTVGNVTSLLLYKNNASYRYFTRDEVQASRTGYPPSVNGCVTVPLLNTDYIDVRVAQNSGGSRSLNTSSTLNYVHINRVDRSEQIAALLTGKLNAPNVTAPTVFFTSLNCDGSSAVTNETFTGTPTIGNISSGSCTLTIPSGNFTDASKIVCGHSVTASNNTAAMLNFTFTSTTSMSIFCVDHNASNCTSFDVRLMCTQY